IGNGCETAIDSNVSRCGSCSPCALPNVSTYTCTAGVCGINVCKSTFADCDFDPANGCEISTSSDPNHCGGCGACALPHVSVNNCVAGSCTIGTCDVGFKSCDTSTANGCETDVSSDPTHCGSCTTVCTPAA